MATHPKGYGWWSGTGNRATIETNTAHIAGSAEELLSKNLHRAVLEQGLFMRMMGPEMGGMPIVFKQELKDQRGDIIHMYFASDLTSQPTSQIATLWDNEEDIQMYQDSVQLGVIKKSAGIEMPMSQQRSSMDLVRVSYATLERWLVNYGPELGIIQRLCGETYLDTASREIGFVHTTESTDASDSSNWGTVAANTQVMYGGDATSEATIDASDILDPDMIWRGVEACRMGKVINGGTTTTFRKFYPIDVMGGKYIGVFHPYQIGDLKYAAGSAWVDFQKFAGLRGNDNPLFVGTRNLAGQLPTPIGELYGMLIYDYARMPVHTDWGENTNINGATGVMLGAEAAAYAVGFGPNWTEEVGRHKEEMGFAVKMIAGITKLTWNSIDNGVLAVKTAAKLHS